MVTSDRGPVPSFGRSPSCLIALITLAAAIGFTPWAWGAGVPWAQFAFRILGLTALFAVSLEHSKRLYASSVWEARATRAMLVLVLVSALSAAFSIHRGKSLEAMLNLLAITGLFLAAASCVRGFGMIRGVALLEVLAAIPVATLGLLQHFRPELLPALYCVPRPIPPVRGSGMEFPDWSRGRRQRRHGPRHLVGGARGGRGRARARTGNRGVSRSLRSLEERDHEAAGGGGRAHRRS